MAIKKESTPLGADSFDVGISSSFVVIVYKTCGGDDGVTVVKFHDFDPLGGASEGGDVADGGANEGAFTADNHDFFVAAHDLSTGDLAGFFADFEGGHALAAAGLGMVFTEVGAFAVAVFADDKEVAFFFDHIHGNNDVVIC